MYQNIYPALAKLLYALCASHGKQSGFVRGSDLHNTVLNFFYGKRIADSYDTEKFIMAFVEMGLLTKAHHCPTPSQLATAGLGYSKAGYKRTIAGSLEYMAGLRTHFAYTVNLSHKVFETRKVE